MTSLDRARKCLERTGLIAQLPDFGVNRIIDGIAAEFDAVAADARSAALREIHVRIREVMMHPSVKDVPIPVALWHLMRNLEHETGDRPIGLTAPEHVEEK